MEEGMVEMENVDDLEERAEEFEEN